MQTVVAGANSALGFEICRQLRAQSVPVIALHRRNTGPELQALEALGCDLRPCDLAVDSALADVTPIGSRLVLVPILTTSGPPYRRLPAGHVRHAVLFSSNNVELDTGCPKYRAIREEEAALATAGSAHIRVRPTMIYGHAQDGNVSRVMTLAKRSRVVPVPSYGQARCQPIHIEDLAALTVRLLHAEPQSEPVLAAGPSPLTMSELMRKIAHAAGPARLTLPIPIPLLRGIAAVAPLPLGADQLARAKQDRVPASVPPVPGWKPRVDIDEGLRRLARLLDAGRTTPHFENTSQ
ncbi:MAG: hypothetical protein AAGJ32_06900 [Pseudomonadota bacterium]